MSKFSGKCDVYDSIVMIREATDLSRYKFYIWVGDRYHKLDIKDFKDLSKYYPYLIGVMVADKEGATVVLSQNSFIDTEEREHIGWYLRDALAAYKRAKRKHETFSAEKYCDEYIWEPNKELKRIVAERVERDGLNANIDGLHDRIHNHFRKEWYEEMVRLGWSEVEAERWVYPDGIDKYNLSFD